MDRCSGLVRRLTSSRSTRPGLSLGVSRQRFSAAAAVVLGCAVLWGGPQAAAVQTVPATTASPGISVHLQSPVPVSVREIQLRDIAVIRCADVRLAGLIGQLDIASLDDGETERVVPASFIRIRMLLAGCQSSQMQLVGPDQILIQYREPQPLTDHDIEQAALATMESALGVPAADLRVRLNSPFMQVLPKPIQDQAGLRAEVLPPIRSQPGQTMLTVRLWQGRDLVATRGARVDVLRRQRVAVAKVSLRRDQILSAADVQFENRFLSTIEDEPADEQVFGRSTRSSLQPGQILSLRDLNDAPAQEKPLVIRPRDNVQVTAVRGVARVTLRTAEALQAGRVGDVIQVKNLESDRIVSGKVVAAGHVEIRL